MARLSKSTIDRFRRVAQDGEGYLWDGELKGFGLRLYPSGAARFVLKFRLASGAQRKLTLGRLGVITPEVARDLAKIALGKVAAGQDPAAKTDPKSLTVSKLTDLYLDAAERGLIIGKSGSAKKASTIYTDRGRVERHIKPLLGRKIASQVTRADIEWFKAAIVTGQTAVDVRTGPHGRAIVKGGRGTATRTLGLLGGIFTWAEQNGHVTDNPVRGVRRFASRQCKALLTATQYALLGDRLRAMKNDTHPQGKPVHYSAGLDCIKLIALTGLRRGEALNLQWSQVDFLERCLRLGETKTGASIRPLSKDAARLLKSIQCKSDNPYVFASPRDLGLPYRGLVGLWATVKGKPGAAAEHGATLHEITLHSLRHSFAGVADELGGTLPTIAALLGQRLGGVTSGYILKRLDAPLLSFADQVGGYLSQAMGEPPRD